jgi:TLC ATP/ADP transporter
MPRLATVLALLLASSDVEAFSRFSIEHPSVGHRIFSRTSAGSYSARNTGCRSSPCIGGRLSGSGPRFMAAAEATTGDDEKKGFVQRIKAIIPTKAERQKLIPLAVMFFCILFNYTILRDTKDVLMVTAPKSGAEVIPFIKTYVNLPAAILFTGIYSKMTDSMEQKNVFYALVIPFLAFFAIFALFIYPQRAILHPHALMDSWAAVLPSNFAAPLAIIRNWSFAVFYVMAEMWGSVVASLLFWGLANEVTVCCLVEAAVTLQHTSLTGTIDLLDRR